MSDRVTPGKLDSCYSCDPVAIAPGRGTPTTTLSLSNPIRETSVGGHLRKDHKVSTRFFDDNLL